MVMQPVLIDKEKVTFYISRDDYGVDVASLYESCMARYATRSEQDSVWR